ncbi:unnamed protein product [Bursaphelenchus xylophilus]|nr:unnamed protein product [Bursaphelenchus xylophilus]CAG9097840.1 unnamed protein product [Bursaphelenchus xylophilus]
MKPKSPTKEKTVGVKFSMKLRNRQVRRVLFGVPDPKETDEWLNKMAHNRAEKAKERWQFDFERERPCSSENGGHGAEIEYESVPEDEVPAFYRSRPARDSVPAHLRTPSKRKRDRSMSLESTEIKNSTTQLQQEVAIKSPRKVNLSKDFKVKKESNYTTPKKPRH